MKDVTLDFSTVRTPDEFHLLLKEKLDFPDYYGENLDALYDCLTDISSQTTIYIKGLCESINMEKRHPEAMRDYIRQTIIVFLVAQRDYETIHPMVVGFDEDWQNYQLPPQAPNFI